MRKPNQCPICGKPGIMEKIVFGVKYLFCTVDHWNLFKRQEFDK